MVPVLARWCRSRELRHNRIDSPSAISDRLSPGKCFLQWYRGISIFNSKFDAFYTFRMEVQVVRCRDPRLGGNQCDARFILKLVPVMPGVLEIHFAHEGRIDPYSHVLHLVRLFVLPQIDTALVASLCDTDLTN